MRHSILAFLALPCLAGAQTPMVAGTPDGLPPSAIMCQQQLSTTPSGTVAGPEEGFLHGQSNYFIYENCNPLQNPTVTVTLLADLISEATATHKLGPVTSPPNDGFSFQLNGDSTPDAATGTNWQQYFIVVQPHGNRDGTLDYSKTDVKAAYELWGPHAPSVPSTLMTTLDNPSGIRTPMLPKGTVVTIALGTDADDNVVNVTFSLTLNGVALPLNPNGKPDDGRNGFFTLNKKGVAPMTTVSLDVVGASNGHFTQFLYSSGFVGTISYSASNTLPLTPTPGGTKPATCAAGSGTAENSTAGYAPLCEETPVGFPVVQPFYTINPYVYPGASIICVQPKCGKLP